MWTSGPVYRFTNTSYIFQIILIEYTIYKKCIVEQFYTLLEQASIYTRCDKSVIKNICKLYCYNSYTFSELFAFLFNMSNIQTN